jgi:tRNA pseudouridine38-40 synthase
LGQVAHFDLDKSYPAIEVVRALNFYLRNNAIAVLDAAIVQSSFDARFSAISRCYGYKIINRLAPLTAQRNLALHISKKLDVGAMQEAASFLLGRHDFSSFRSGECGAKSPIKNVYLLEIVRDGVNIDVRVSASSFLHHMVRNIVGTLLMIGIRKMAPEVMLTILEARERKFAGPTVAACGLYLVEACYLDI